jgi:hypothetical protein
VLHVRLIVDFVFSFLRSTSSRTHVYTATHVSHINSSTSHRLPILSYKSCLDYSLARPNTADSVYFLKVKETQTATHMSQYHLSCSERALYFLMKDLPLIVLRPLTSPSGFARFRICAP